MATASIGGLGSGLDTAGIVSQLMQLEALPQAKLKNRVLAEESTVKALQGLNAKLAALVTKATDLGKADAWKSLSATSSLAGVSVTATADATPTNLSMTVDRIATSHQVGFRASDVTSTTLPTNVTLTTSDGTETTLTTDGSLQGFADAVNAATTSTGVRATVVQGSTGAGLIIESTETGAASQFTLTSAGVDIADPSQVRAGGDAEISLGAGVTVSSSTNTFADLMPGVTVTLSAAAEVGKPGDVVVARDADKQTEAVKSFVEGINTLLSEIDRATAYDAATKTSGQLSGESSVRALRTALATSLYPADGTSMADLGLQTDRYGKLVFDEEVFAKAYEADPTRIAAAFGDTGDGFAARVKSVADSASDKYTGTLTSAIQGRTDGIARLNDSIAAWDLRLELRQTTLTRQFTALDVALGRMNNQSSWLASQINSLPSYDR